MASDVRRASKMIEIERLAKQRIAIAHADDQLFEDAQEGARQREAGDTGVPWRELRDAG